MNVLIFGLGYSAQHYLTTRLNGQRVVATVRSKEKLREIGAAYTDVEALIFEPISLLASTPATL